MGRLKRMSEEDYIELKKQYEEVDKEYQAIREKRALIKRRIAWYEYSNEKLLHSYRQGLSYELFGKRKKDLTKEELKEYNRISARRTREKQKGESENDDTKNNISTFDGDRCIR